MKGKFFVTMIMISLFIVGCQPLTDEPAGGPEKIGPPDEIGTSDSVDAVSVNLEDVSNDPPEDIGNVEMPSPGGRGSEAKLIHDVSFDLSQRLGTDVSEVNLVEIIPVTWPDGSLGCPAEGVGYTEAEVEGYQITLEYDGIEYDYHAAGLVNFVLCDEGTPAAPLE